MSDEQLLKSIQNDIKNIDDECIDYLKSIQKELRKQEIEIVKRMSIKKALKEYRK